MRCPNCNHVISADCIDICNLSDRHRAALKLFVEKFKKGAAEHGDLELGRVWTRDILDEVTDMAFYSIFQLLELLDEDKEV